MDKRIIFTNDKGGISIICPAPECGLTIEQIAQKDVPAGKEYKIVDVSEIPLDRTYRNSWEIKEGKIEENTLKKKVIDDAVAQKAVDALVEEKKKELAIEALKADGVLDVNGKVK